MKVKYLKSLIRQDVGHLVSHIQTDFFLIT